MEHQLWRRHFSTQVCPLHYHVRLVCQVTYHWLLNHQTNLFSIFCDRTKLQTVDYLESTKFSYTATQSLTFFVDNSSLKPK